MRQKRSITRLSDIFIVIHADGAVSSFLKGAKSIQCHLSNCLEEYVTVENMERWSGNQDFILLLIVQVNKLCFTYTGNA